jgi:saccharopine dehydrogenase-like NADP-dependent oxidoreductase
MRGVKRVLILGAGRIGQCVAYLLARGDHLQQRYNVHVMDVSADSLALVDPYLVTKHAGKFDKDIVKGYDYVLNLLPHTEVSKVAEACYENEVNYLDVTEDRGATAYLKELLSGFEHDVSFIPQCGLAPGFINILASSMASRFEDLRELRMRVGSLPIDPTNPPLNYYDMWSIDGVVNEYFNPCEVIRDGARAEVAGMDGLESLMVEGRQYEAFNTSGGIGTMPERFLGRVRDMDYKTIRYPGHRACIDMLRTSFGMGREQLQSLMTTLPGTALDTVVVQVTATGRRERAKGQKMVTETVSRVYYPASFGPGATRFSAIQNTTAHSLCAVLDLHLQGKIPHGGLVHQSDIPLAAFAGSHFGRAMADGLA